jgi:hypothetical protein
MAEPAKAQESAAATATPNRIAFFFISFSASVVAQLLHDCVVMGTLWQDGKASNLSWL